MLTVASTRGTMLNLTATGAGRGGNHREAVTRKRASNRRRPDRSTWNRRSCGRPRGGGDAEGADEGFAAPVGVEFTDRGQEYLNSLPVAEQRELLAQIPVTAVTTVVAADVPAPVPAGMIATACVYDSAHTSYFNNSGGIVMKYFHTQKTCIDSSRVTSARVSSTSGQVWYVGWRYEGRIDGGGAVIGGRGVSFSQGKFVLGSGGWDIAYWYPCLHGSRTARAGSISWSHQCGL